MNLRDALVQQSPSLALQRAAADEISSLDAQISSLDAKVCQSDEYLKNIASVAAKLCEKASNLEDYLEAHDLTKDFEVWLALNKEE